NARLWGASRPGYPDTPATPRQVEAAEKERVGVGGDSVGRLMGGGVLSRLCPGFFGGPPRHALECFCCRFPGFGALASCEAPAFCALIEDVRARLARGQGVLVHCNAGQGRTAVFLAALLKGCGLAGDAVEEIRRIYFADAMRGVAQEAFVRALLV